MRNKKLKEITKNQPSDDHTDTHAKDVDVHIKLEMLWTLMRKLMRMSVCLEMI